MSDEYVTKHDCASKFSQIMEAIGKVEKKVDSTNNRLFRDNGNRSHQTILNDHERILRVLCRVVTIVGSALIVGIIGLIFARISI